MSGQGRLRPPGWRRVAWCAWQVFRRIDRLLGVFAWLFVRTYQFTLSPWLGGACRFQPTCSRYALQAIERYGGVRGVWLACKRVLRCHPWGGWGPDPVPRSH